VENVSPSGKLGGPVAIIVAGAVLAGMVFFTRSEATPAPSPTPHVAGVVAAAAVPVEAAVQVEATDPVLGTPESPVTIIEFGDFQCPFCREFHQTTLPKLRETYIDTGQVRFVFKDFPLSQIHPEAHVAAVAARCAAAQGKFWEYGDVLFVHQDALTEGHLATYAGEVGLDAETFSACLADANVQTLVAAAARAAIAAGVTATPSFVIDGNLYEGALSFEDMSAIIDGVRAASPTP
jgi:protein-disulfide isomerase